MMLRRTILLFFASLIPFAGIPSSYAVAADSEVAREYKIKAAYLFNITKFVKWEGVDDISPLTLCIVGKNPFGHILDQLNGRLVNGRTLKISHVASSDSLETCSVAFVNVANQASGLSDAHRHSVLTIGEDKKFVKSGGVIALSKANNKIGLTVNLTNARKSGLHISANLLEVATVIE